MNNLVFRKALSEDASIIWEILQGAIARRKADGSYQWQDGYPNPTVVAKDIESGSGYVLTQGEEVIAYVAILINDEPEYARLRGTWLTNGDFVVFHRVAVAEAQLGTGLAQTVFHFIEEFARKHAISSIKADTNFDNYPMLRIFEKMGYTYCGEVTFRGTPRCAYEKVI